MGWKVAICMDLQITPITTNAVLVLFSILPKNHESNEEIKLIYGFSLNNWITYYIPRIFSADYGGEFDLKVEIPALIFPEIC